MEQTAQALPAPSGMSAQINLIAAALAKAQAQIRSAEKDRENPHLKTAYATLASVWNAAREPLSSAGLSVTQPSSYSQERKSVLVETVLMHGSGQWIRSELELPVVKVDPQGIGSAITYARRYALSALVGIAPDDDDDGTGTGTGSSSGSGSAAPRDTPQSRLPPYPADKFEANAPKWHESIATGQRTPEQIIAMVSTKGVLSDQQTKAIRAMAAPVEQAA